MARHSAIPFQFDKPVFVKIPFQARGRIWEVDTHFKWKEMSIQRNRVLRMYVQGFLYHDEDLEESIKPQEIGDGLEELDLESLHAKVKEINAKVKEKTKTEGEFAKKKCKLSQIKAKQIGLIRSWRRNFGNLE